MDAKPIVMDGASMDASYIASFTREEFIAYNLKVHTFGHRANDVRIQQLNTFYDIAVKLYPEEFPEPKKKRNEKAWLDLPGLVCNRRGCDRLYLLQRVHTDMTYTGMIDNFKAMDIKSIAGSVMQSNSGVFIKLNKEQMLSGKGKTKNIGRYLSGVYARFKAEMNPKPGTGNVDLRLTGSFQDQMFMKVQGEGFEIGSTDSKAGDLENKYGVQIFGLNDGSRVGFIDDYLLPDFHKLVGKMTGLKFS
jgi:hypothetical protein